jgi:membrane-associated HD superfamily phosphohydrolase
MEDLEVSRDLPRKMYKLPLLIAISIFSISMIFLWVIHYSEMNKSIIIIGGGYALMCLVFLIFQIFAFVRAHIIYDEDVEGIKFKVFEVENDEYKKNF